MKKIFLIFLCLGLFFSCAVDNSDLEQPLLAKSEQQVLLSKMKEATLVLSQFAGKEEVKKELDQIIKLKMYNDDFVFFKDLFAPSDNEVLKSASIAHTVFEKEFDQVLLNHGLKSSEVDDLKTFLVSNNLVLYIPYPIETYQEDKQVPTISYHPLENDSINEGIISVKQSNDEITYKTVIVNAEYALKNMCYLIIPADMLSYEAVSYKEKSVEAPTVGQHYEIRVGKAICYHHYDGIFGGGSEIYFGLVTGDVSLTSGQVTAVPKGFMRTIPRTAIDFNYHVDINTMFIADWKTDLTQVSVFIYEDDPSGSREASGSVKSTVTSKITGNVTAGGSSSTGSTPNVTTETTGAGLSGETGGAYEYSASWKATVQSQDMVIMNQDYPRDWFFATNTDETAEWGKWSNEYGVIYRGVQGQFAFCLTVREQTY